MEDITKIKQIVAEAKEIAPDFTYKPLTSGHINKTYLIQNNNEKLVLQKLNTTVFENLDAITQNILNVSNHLKNKTYPHTILQPIVFNDGAYLYDLKWRMFEYIEDTQTFLKVQSTQQAFEAARFLSFFHAHISDIAIKDIQDPIEGFLDFEKRLHQYEQALQIASKKRLQEAHKAISYINDNKFILQKWIMLMPQLPTRIIHADPKISNFLFDKEDANKIIALIDWDTILCGSVLYDFGDMVRSYTNLKEEDDPKAGNNFSLENYRALEEGFLYHLKDILTIKEIENLALGAKTVIYVQAMRFLTDFLNDDVYYAIQHPKQNLDRTMSQINLLKDMQEKLAD